MSFSQRAGSLAEVAERILGGADPGFEVRDFLHQFKLEPSYGALEEKPQTLDLRVEDGARLDAFVQALAVYLSTKLGKNPPPWTQPPVRLRQPWFASPGAALRHYLLISSPAPFRARNLFIDEDSLEVV